MLTAEEKEGILRNLEEMKNEIGGNVIGSVPSYIDRMASILAEYASLLIKMDGRLDHLERETLDEYGDGVRR